MRQEHAGHGKRIESELRDTHDFPGAADATASVLEAELAGQDHHVMFRAQLLRGERFQCLGGLGRQAEAVGAQFTLGVVVELAVTGFPEALERLQKSGFVGRGHPAATWGLRTILPSRRRPRASSASRRLLRGSGRSH
jgi:hypothetical protein